MKTLFTPLLALFLGASSAALGQAPLKIATIDMESLFNDYHLTAEVQRDVNIERARIQKENNTKLAAIREIDEEIQSTREVLQDQGISEKERLSLNEKQRELSQDGKQRQRERTQFLERRNRALNESMQKRMRSILSKIQRAIGEEAKEGSYDFIIDSSGKTSQGVPFVLYASETTDLTQDLLTKLNAGADE